MYNDAVRVRHRSSLLRRLVYIIIYIIFWYIAVARTRPIFIRLIASPPGRAPHHFSSILYIIAAVYTRGGGGGDGGD